MTPIQNLKLTRERISGLKKILSQIDPASGFSIAFRRGVARDNDDIEDDDTRRPWVTCELGGISSEENLGKSLMEKTLEALKDLETFWMKAVQRDLEEMQKELMK